MPGALRIEYPGAMYHVLTAVALKWIAKALHMGAWTHVAKPPATCEREKRIQRPT